MPPWIRRPGRRLTGPWSVVDGNDPEGLPYPVEAGRYRYVTPFGGFSVDLDPGEIGLHRQALIENTELDTGDEVTVRVLGEGPPSSFFVRPTYVLVGLDFSLPDAWLHSVRGEAVLSANERVTRDPDTLARLRDGLQVIINGVLARTARA